MCGNDDHSNDVHTVGVGCLFNKQSSLDIFVNMDVGILAERENYRDEWKYSAFRVED